MKKLLVALLFLAGCSVSSSPTVSFDRSAILQKPVYGQDTLALELPAFSEKTLAAANGKGGAFTVLHTTFGTNTAPVRQLLKSNTPAYFEAKIINGSCHSDHNCGAYEFASALNMAALCDLAGRKDPKFKAFYQSSVAVYRDLASQFPLTKFLISPINEHGCAVSQYRVLADWTLATFPAAQLVNSPLGGVSVEEYRGAWIERHGNKNLGGAQIASLDGVDASQIDLQKFLKDTAHFKIVYIWGSPYNCRLNTWQDPRSRTACPNQGVFELYAHMTDSRPADPPTFTGLQCKKIIPFQAPMIWKPLAEYAPYDHRSWLPVLITNRFSPNAAVQVLAANGKPLGSLGYYSSYLDQGWRWYSGFAGSAQSGYQLRHAAEIQTGSPYVWLLNVGVCLGPLQPGERQGKFD